MKKTLLTLTALSLLIRFSAAQSFLGLHASPYGGITNVDYNPAIADNRFLVDVNLIGLGVNFTNNYLGISRHFLFHSKTDTATPFADNYLKERLNGHNKSVALGLQLQGPLSFMFSFGFKGEDKNRNAVGFSWHVNSVTNVDKFDEKFARISFLGEGYTADSILRYRGQNLSNVHPSVKTLTWIDYDLTFSRVIKDDGPHMIKVGGTLKILRGMLAAYAYVDNLKYKWDNYDTLSLFQSSARWAYGTGAPTSRNFSTDGIKNGEGWKQYIFDLAGFKYSSPSVAVDLGVIYEWRPDKEKYRYSMDCEDTWKFWANRYKLSAGLSVIDLGAIPFKSGQYSGSFNANITGWDVSKVTFKGGIQSIADTVNTRFQVTPDKGNFTMWLPTRFNMFVDYNIGYGAGVNLQGVISPNMAPKRNMVHQASVIALTPKYDNAWFGAYMPLSTDFKGNYNWGLTLRGGPIIIGSSDLFGFLIKKHAYNLDIHIALKITIPYMKKHDKDKDGVSNGKDKCPKEPGECVTHGCPDRDHDGVLDKDDECPDDPGPVELKGCPDSDGDGIIDRDDSCVHVKGPAKYHGCPDTDGDGIIDKYDDCPTEPGLAQFHGCPDRDSDGTPDKLDKCPTVPGPKDHFGCPDTDGDGLYDYEDSCVNVKGPKENHGCPWPDRDHDGVIDRDDSCPTVFGVPENHGCPMLEKKELETVKFAFENLEFETAKDIIRTHSFPSLTALANLLIKKPNYGLRIEGHTDNVGTPEHNQSLSERRAASVKKFLVDKGVDPNKLETHGYGLTRPVADNSTPAGRQKNRRVEMTITFK